MTHSPTELSPQRFGSRHMAVIKTEFSCFVLDPARLSQITQGSQLPGCESLFHLNQIHSDEEERKGI